MTMKRAMTTMTFAAAALITFAVTGNAQSMKAEVPFPFENRGASLQPGRYTLSFLSNGGSKQVLQIYSYDQRRSVIALGWSSDGDARKLGSTPVATFQCTEGHC